MANNYVSAYISAAHDSCEVPLPLLLQEKFKDLNYEEIRQKINEFQSKHVLKGSSISKALHAAIMADNADIPLEFIYAYCETAANEISSEPDQMVVEILLQRVPESLHRYIDIPRYGSGSELSDKRVEKATKKITAITHAEKREFEFVTTSGHKLKIASKSTIHGRQYSVRNSGDKKDFKIIGEDRLKKHVASGGGVRASNSDLGVSSSIFRLGGNCKALGKIVDFREV
jgi:hypothetical protein